MEATSDLAQTIAEVAYYYKQADRILTGVHFGATLTQAKADALAAATRRADAALDAAFTLAAAAGVEFFTIDCDGYAVVETYENGRWEAFTTVAVA